MKAGCSTAMNEESTRLIHLARRDLRAVQGMLHHEDSFPDEIFGFHAQQAVEKASKAWLAGRGIEYPKTHDLDLLFDMISDHNPGFLGDFDVLRDLVDFSVQYRYEAFDDLPLDREPTLRLLEQFIEVIVTNLSE